MDGRTPKCPYCGARSTWLWIRPFIYELRRCVDICHTCKMDELRWEREWIKGPDVVEGRV